MDAQSTSMQSCSVTDKTVSRPVSSETFDALWEQHIDALAGASRRATDQVRQGAFRLPENTFTPDFFVGIIDFGQGDAGIEYLTRSVDIKVLRVSGILEDA